MRGVHLALVACLVLSPRAYGAEGEAKKWLVGRWAPVPAKPAEEAKPAVASKAKMSPKRSTARKTSEPAPLPKCLLEFTKDGKVLLDGDFAPLSGLGFLKPLKPLTDFGTRLSPQTKNIKITYQFTGDDAIEVSADHTWLLEKLSGGGSPPSPEKAKELIKEYQPRETLKVVAKYNELRLTDDQGQSFTFRRYTGLPLAEAEGKRREEELRRGMAPLNSILEQQGINTGRPSTGKSASKKKGGSQPPP
jgi:hypothetical protein